MTRSDTASGSDIPRCPWAGTDPRMRAYHDEEWGVPERSGRALWEKLMLDGFQAGLSWSTILNKRDAFRVAFQGFDPPKVSMFEEADVLRLLGDASIVRSRSKIEATITGATAYLAMQDAGEEFSAFCWSFIGKKPIVNDGPTRPTQTPLSERISKELKRRGFKYCGPTIVYAWMQATGMVNDHDAGCFRRQQLIETGR